MVETRFNESEKEEFNKSDRILSGFFEYDCVMLWSSNEKSTRPYKDLYISF